MPFVLALLIGINAIVIIACTFMCASWLKDYISKRLQQKENHKVAFVDTREAVDDYLQSRTDTSDEISITELENLCNQTPFVAVDIDKVTGDLSKQEGMKPESVDSNFSANMKKQKGILIFD